MNGMCNGDLMFYIACVTVHRDIKMLLNKTDSCIWIRHW